LKIQKLAEANKYRTQQESDGRKYQTIKEAEAQSESIKNLANANAEKIQKEAVARAYEVEKTGTAEASRIKAIGESEAFREREVGKAKGEAYMAQIKAYGNPQFYVMKEVMGSFTEAIKDGKIPLVPTIVMGSGDSKIPNVFENMMSLVLTEKITGKDFLAEALKNTDKN